MIPKSKAWRSERYLAWVRSLPCCMTGEEGCEAHHVIGLKYGLSGWGLKAPDSFVMPLTPWAHRMVHQRVEWQAWQVVWLRQTINAGLEQFPSGPIHNALQEALEFVREKTE